MITNKVEISFLVISATEKSQVSSSEAELDVCNDPLRGKNIRGNKIFERRPSEIFVTFTSKFEYVL